MGLTHAHCQDLFDINDRNTIAKWESGKSIIPCGVAEEIADHAKAFLQGIDDFCMTRKNVCMLVYPDDLPECMNMANLTYMCQYATAGLVAAKLGDSCRIIEFNQQQFSDWCQANNREESPTAIYEWMHSLPEPRTLDSLHKK